ncbi:MAG: glycosyltransferase, partial [Gemmatimonadota bacterium]|nr:glycosyltransferase [Gemmatimonadota bacterium]
MLNIGPSRRERRPECVDVQSGSDYLRKLVRFAVRRYRFHVHANGDSPKGFVLIAVAYGVGLASGLRPVLTFHAGISQRFFPRKSLPWRIFFRLFFGLPSRVICNSDAVRRAITAYGISEAKVHAIPAFTTRYVEDLDTEEPLPTSISSFLARHSPVLACYAYFRPEFELDSLLRAVAAARRDYDDLGLVLIGHLQGHEPVAALARELGIANRVHFAGDLPHGQFLATMREVDLCIRTHTRDGVSSSVLEALALGTPVLACR